MNIILTGSTTGETGTITYEWKDGLGNSLSSGTLSGTTTQEVTSADTYTLTVIDDYNGAIDTESFTITDITGDPIADISSVTTEFVTDGQEIILYGTGSYGQYPESNLTYSWTATNGGILTGSTSSSSATAITGGTYTLIVTDTYNQCTGTTSITLTEIVRVNPTAIIIGDNLLTCDVTSLVLNGNTSYGAEALTYLWSGTTGGGITTPLTGQTITVISGGTYGLVVSEPNSGNSSELITFEVTESINPPTVNILKPDGIVLSSSQPKIRLSTTVVADETYNWATLDGNIISGNTYEILLDSEGTYTLTVTNSVTGCESSSGQTITITNATLPIVNINGDNVINCNITSLVLDGSTSTGTGTLNYLWTTDVGNIVGSTTGQTITVDSGGIYTLTVTDDVGVSSKSKTINENSTLPTTTIDTPDGLVLSVAQPSLTLSSTIIDNDYSYLWSTTGGTITTPTTSSITIEDVGFYSLQITNIISGCEDIDTVEVTVNNTVPVAKITLALPELPSGSGSGSGITCDRINITLSGNTSTGEPILTYQWSGTTSGLLGTVSAQTITTGDTYWLEVTDGNGNKDVTSITIAEDLDVPTATIDSPDGTEVSVGQPSLTLSSTTIDNDYDYLWSATTSGNIIGVTTGDTITIDSDGIYMLTITNTVSGCEDSDSIEITVDTTVPAAKINGDNLLTCDVTSLVLDGSTSSGVAPLTYLWSKTGGTITTPLTGQTITIEDAGFYGLEVTDGNTATNFIIHDEVTENITLPTTTIDTPDGLEISVGQLTLVLSSTTIDNDYSYLWSTTGGTITTPTTSTITVEDAGFYSLLITNTVTGCEDIDTKEVTVDDTAPIARITLALPELPSGSGSGSGITCDRINITLSGHTSVGIPTLTYQWSGTTSGLLGTASTETITTGDTYWLEVTDGNTNTNVTSITIAEDLDVPTATIDYPDGLILHAGQTSLTLSSTTIDNDYSYLWSTTGGTITTPTAPTITVTDGGFYSLQITNTISGCEDSDTVEVTVDNTVPIAKITLELTDILGEGTGSGITCDRINITLSGHTSVGAPTLTYQWSGTTSGLLGTGLTETITTGDTYWLEVTDGNGNKNVTSKIIAEDLDVPTATIDYPDGLEISVGQPSLTLSSTTIDNDYTYLWSTTGGTITIPTTSSITVTDGGFYSLLITNTISGCEDSDTVEVTVDDTVPVAKIRYVNTSITTLTCDVTSLGLKGTASTGVAPLTYLWSTTDGTITTPLTGDTITVTGVGTYGLEVTDGNTATDFAIREVTQNITLPTVNILKDPNITELSANNPSIILSSTTIDNDYSYLWSKTGGTITTPTTSSITVTSADTYTLTITNVITGCEAEDTVNITLKPPGDYPTVRINGNELLTCDVTSLVLDGSASTGISALDYLWTTDVGNIVGSTTGQTITVDSAGTYRLTVTDNTSEEGLLEVTVIEDITNPVSIITKTPNDVNLTFTNPSKVLSALDSTSSNGLVYLWGGPITGTVTGNTITVTEAGTYTLTVTDIITGCNNQSEVEIFKDPNPPVAIISGDTTIYICNTSGVK